MSETSESDDLLHSSEQHLAASQPDERWTEEDSLLLLHLHLAIDAAHRKGYSEALVQLMLQALWSRHLSPGGSGG